MERASRFLSASCVGEVAGRPDNHCDAGPRAAIEALRNRRGALRGFEPMAAVDNLDGRSALLIRVSPLRRVVEQFEPLCAHH